MNLLEEKIKEYLSLWDAQGLPSRTGYADAAEDVLQWRLRNHISGLSEGHPVMLTATLDDGWGHGIQLIQCFAEAAGLRVLELGLLQPVESILEACYKHLPRILGLTVLQFDSEDALTTICRKAPPETTILVGGPVFLSDDELASRAGVHYVIKNAAEFWSFLLKDF